jgi:hypothetical protein
MKTEQSRSPKKVLNSLQSLVKSIKKSYKDVFQADKEMKIFFSASDMKEAGKTIKEMKEMGYSVKELKEAALTVIQLKEGGYSLKELFDGGFTLSELKDHYSLETLLSSSVIADSGVNLKKEGYSIEEVMKAGKTAAEMKNYYSLLEIRDEYGLSRKELRDLGYNEVDLSQNTIIDSKGFESSVVINLPFILDLLSLLPSNLSSTSLLYRGSRDGFDVAAYHAKCDNEGPLLIIVKCDKGYIFGGYASVNVPTSYDGKYAADPSNSSFLFSLKNPQGEIVKKYPIKLDYNKYAFYSHSTRYGFYFGNNGDMYSKDMKIVNFNYSSPSYEDYGEGNYRFTGKTPSTISEVEIWKVNS